MLQQAGWQEGMGLGSQGQGITAPVDKYEHDEMKCFVCIACIFTWKIMFEIGF